APRGPVVLTVTAFPNATAGIGVNRTWVDVPGGCCAQDGHPTWATPPTLNVSRSAVASGSVDGTVELVAPGTTRPGPPDGVIVSFSACPAAPTPSGPPTPPCSSGASNATTGTFNFTAPLGWDIITAGANGYAQNFTWVDVTGDNATGIIVLAADALIGGRVLDPSGHGIYAANVVACPADAVATCDTGKPGTLSGTDGRFNL